MATAARADFKVRIDTVDRAARASKVRGCAVLPIFAFMHFALHCHWQNQQHAVVSCTSDVTTDIMAPHKCGTNTLQLVDRFKPSTAPATLSRNVRGTLREHGSADGFDGQCSQTSCLVVTWCEMSLLLWRTFSALQRRVERCTSAAAADHANLHKRGR